MINFFKVIFTITVCLLYTGCEIPGSVPTGRIKIKNDSQDKSYNILQVYAGGVGFNLKPGENKLLPQGSKSFSFKRQYKDYTRSYSIECNDFSSSSKGITVKMLDVHTNRIAGGCKTVSAEKY